MRVTKANFNTCETVSYVSLCKKSDLYSCTAVSSYDSAIYLFLSNYHFKRVIWLNDGWLILTHAVKVMSIPINIADPWLLNLKKNIYIYPINKGGGKSFSLLPLRWWLHIKSCCVHGHYLNWNLNMQHLIVFTVCLLSHSCNQPLHELFQWLDCNQIEFWGWFGRVSNAVFLLLKNYFWTP